jgi:hypothetical protein
MDPFTAQKPVDRQMSKLPSVTPARKWVKSFRNIATAQLIRLENSFLFKLQSIVRWKNGKALYQQFFLATIALEQQIAQTVEEGDQGVELPSMSTWEITSARVAYNTIVCSPFTTTSKVAAGELKAWRVACSTETSWNGKCDILWMQEHWRSDVELCRLHIWWCVWL